jgi:cob(I)alamin adenosyltransferase
MDIYTKKGDHGSTSNLLGETLSKADIILQLQGDIDETNAYIGHLRATISADHPNVIIDRSLRNCQYSLFRIGSDVATKFNKEYIQTSDIEKLEKSIDEMTSKAGELKNFIYYNGTISATMCQVIRSVVRRSERTFVTVLQYLEWEGDFPIGYQYVNRLSDYFFTLARYFNFMQGVNDDIMKLV